MTVSSLSLKWMRPLAAAIFVTLLPWSGLARADDPVKGEVKVFTANGYVRLLFRFDETVPATVHFNFPIVVVNFKKPVAVSVDRLNENAPDFISAARIDPDGKAIRIALAKKAKVHPIPAAERLYVDLLPEPWAGVVPGLPEEVVEELANRAREAERQLQSQRRAAKDSKPPTVRVRVASQPTFIRYVFDVPNGINVVTDRHDDQLTLNFDRPMKWDLADVLATLPPTVKAVDANIDHASVAVNFVFNGNPKVRTFREDTSIAVDIGLDGAIPKHAKAADADAPAAAATTPAIAPPDTVPAKEPAKEEAAAKQAADPAKDAPPLIDMTPPAKKAADKPPAAPPKNGSAAAPAEKMVDKTPAASKASGEAMPAAAAPAQKMAEPARQPAASKAAAPEPAAKDMQAAKPAAEKPEAAKPAAVKPAAAKTAAPEAAKKEMQAAKPAAAKPEAAAMAKAAAKSAAAEPGKPAPAAEASVVTELRRDGDALRLEFPFVAPTPAAVFRRADTVWLVFDSDARIDLSALTREPDSSIRDARFERAKDGAAIVRLQLKRPRLASVMTDGNAWIVNIGERATVPTKPLIIARNVIGKNRASIAIPFDNPRALHRISDAALGGELMVITGLAPARGFLKPQNFVELRALPSVQGVVLQPLADDVAAELAADKVTITRPGGLSLSATVVGQQQLATNFRALTFDTQIWGFNRQAPYNARQSQLVFEAAMAPPAKRRKARMDLARFYLARGMSAEAIGVVEVAMADAHAADDITGTVLKSIGNVMLDRPTDALKDLSKPQVGNQLDAPVWRAIAFTQQGKWREAHDLFKDVEAALGGLPIELQRMALREELHAAIELRDFVAADRVLNELETIGVPPEMQPSIAVLVGRLDQGLGRNEDALTNYRAAAASRDERSAAQARLREIMLRFAIGDMLRKDVVDQLETLTASWRGDETEAEGLKLLAHLYTEDKRYRDAFHVMRTAMLAHANSDLTRQIQSEAAATFESLFLDGKGDTMAPIEALALFYDYRELTPVGRRGDEMIRKLADRLASVDLLAQAAELLQHQVDHRLHGAARAQVATHLAVMYLMNRKPMRALEALRASRVDGLSNEVRDQRLLLEARALSETSRYDLALEMIANIKGREAIRLRADILWAAERWRQAAEQIELLYGDRWRDFTPLSEAERIDVLRAAIGYALGDEALGLARFRDRYAAKMADTPDRHAFEVVTAPVGASGPEFKNVARTVGRVDSLDEFLDEMRKRYPDSAPAAADGATGDKAASPQEPAKPGADRGAPDKAAANAKPNPAASPLPPKAPAGTPRKPETTGSIPRLPRAARN
jgi:hypothetical protein